MVTKGGMSPRDALIAATKGGPDLMDLSSETGTLEPGKSADLIAVEGDPLVDPTAVQRVDYVMVEGKPDPDERTMMRSLLALLAAALRRAAYAAEEAGRRCPDQGSQGRGGKARRRHGQGERR